MSGRARRGAHVGAHARRVSAHSRLGRAPGAACTGSRYCMRTSGHAARWHAARCALLWAPIARRASVCLSVLAFARVRVARERAVARLLMRTPVIAVIRGGGSVSPRLRSWLTQVPAYGCRHVWLGRGVRLTARLFGARLSTTNPRIGGPRQNL